MSVVFFSRIAITGSQSGVHQFRKDARRVLPANLKKQLRIATIALSFEKLFRLHPELDYSEADPPGDEYHYIANSEASTRWHEFTQAHYTLEVANVQIHELLLPLSRYYPELAFVNSELCLDDSSVSSACTRCKRQYLWDLPEKQTEAHWKAAAEAEGMDVETAYETDDCGVRWDAEDRMVRDGLAHWDKAVLRFLRRAPLERRVSS